MKKRPFSKLISLLLAALLLMSMSVVTVSAYASGTGTQADPYLITSAKELQNVNSNLSASYKLAASIDLKGVDFVPLGNAEDGAFTGTFDGNGFTISNLDVHAGKYAGLFGCNEGAIKNVTLDDIYVYGNRYLGGVCGQNTKYGTVENCTVLGGLVTSDGGLEDIYIGGIIGQNDGILKDHFANSADIKVSDGPFGSYSDEAMSYAGGIVGENSSNIEINVMNFGDITSVVDDDKFNLSRVGGIVGVTTASLDIRDSSNNGDLKAVFNASDYELYYTRFFCVLGGLVGQVMNGASVNIESCSNNGNFSYSANYYRFVPLSGGIIGDAYGAGNITIEKVYNTGMITGYESGGIIGRNDYDNMGGGSVNISNAFQAGAITPVSSGCGMICGDNETDTFLTNCYNIGMPTQNNHASHPFTLHTYDISNSYYLKNRTYDNALKSEFAYSEEDLKNQNNFTGWNFETVWEVDKNINSGYPILRNMPSSLMLNIQSINVTVGTTIQLKAYKDDVATDNVTWSIVSGNAILTDDGTVTLNRPGNIIISAQDDKGFKSNCLIYAYIPASSVELQDRTIRITESGASNNSYYSLNGTNTDFIVEWTSDNTNVVQVNENGALTAVAVGTATITARTYGGAVGTQKVTVVDTIYDLTLPSSDTVARGSQKQIDATVRPDPTSSKITWTSSNNDVATVDQNGVVTGVSVGQAVITATTDNGYSDTCTVTVNAPVTSMHFERPSVTVYKNDTDKLNLITDPADTTDTISYSSSSSRVSVSSDGTITAGSSTGTATITATSSSGVKAYCTVTVIDQPVPVESVSLNERSKSLQVEEVFKLTASVLPETATNQTVTWRSTDDSVASVNGDGTVTAVGAGKAVITAEAENGALDYCEVTVTGPNSKNLSKIYVPDVVQADGDSATVPVLIEHNPGISFASLTVAYDPAVLQPLSVTNGAVFDSVLGSIEAGDNVVKLCFTSEDNVTADGALAYIRFQVVGDLSGQTPVTVRYFPDEIRNAASEPVAFNLLDGMIDVDNEPSENVMGDVDGNGLINAADAVLVLRHDAGLILLTAQQLAVADVSQDGVVNASDAVQILRFDAGLIEL